MDIELTRVLRSLVDSVSIALGKRPFSFRTRKLSPAAAIILRKWKTSTMPFYIKPQVTPGVLSFVFSVVLRRFYCREASVVVLCVVLAWYLVIAYARLACVGLP